MAGGFLAFRCSNYDNTAEREQFRLLCNKMKLKFGKSGRFYLLIGNYNIYDSEFDAIVIKHDAIIAVEFKNYGGDIVACENGDWTSNGMVIKGGSRKTVYQQARANHSSLRNGLKDLGIERLWLKDIPTIIVFNQTISLDNQLSGKVRSWLHVTDNTHFIEKVEDITCPSTNLSNIDIINLAIKLNLNPFLIQELSSYSSSSAEESGGKVSQNEKREDADTIIEDVNKKILPQSHTDTDLLKIIDAYDRFTPNHIFSLRSNQVFVFGTDRTGSQKYGAAGLAAMKFGAQVGVIDGPTGHCYALPTKGFSISDLGKAVSRFIDYVHANSQLTFLVTPVGCGHAGFDIGQVANMFKALITLSNVMLPDVFIKEYRAAYERQTLFVDEFTDESDHKSATPDDIINCYNERLSDVIRYLLSNEIEFNLGGSFVIENKSRVVIGEAELGVESEKAVFYPFNIQSEQAFKNKGYTIWDPVNYLQSKTK